MVPKLWKYTVHLSIKAAGTSAISRPSASLIWVEKMVNAIPLVKPTTRGCGIKRNSEPNFSNPNMIMKMPAKMVEIISPSRPYCATMPEIMMTNAPVGPPICTRLPPNKEIKKPAMMAVTMPLSGETPEATAKAMASGNATIPTIMPENKSLVNCFLEYPFFSTLKNLG